MATLTKSDANVTSLLAVSKLPAFPSVALRMMELIQRDNANFLMVGDLLKTDAALSSAVLRAANSPLFGVRGEIKSIPVALVTLGLDRVSLLILTTAMYRVIPGGLSRAALRPWWVHNLASALVCSHLSAGQMADEYSYMCGLMHSVGQLALYTAFPQGYGMVLESAAAAGASLVEVERQHYSVDHCELGAALLRKWNIPEEMIDAAAHHHTPDKAACPSTRLVHTGCLVSNHLGFQVAAGPLPPVESLPEEVRRILADEPLRLSLLERVEVIEKSLAVV